MASILGKPGGPGQFPTHDLSTVRGALQIVFEFAMDCLPARCRCGTSTDKNTHREEPVRRSAATGPTPAISRRERAEKKRAPPLHDNPKARRRGGRHTRGAAACCDARFRPDL